MLYMSFSYVIWLNLERYRHIKHSSRVIKMIHLFSGEPWVGKVDEIDYFSEIKEATGYGKEWILFPDGDDIPHFVNLSLPDVLPLSRNVKIREIEYRLYARLVLQFFY